MIRFAQGEHPVRKRYTAIQGWRKWVDPYPDIPGTEPEKMVYAQMIVRGIPFQFQEYLQFFLPDLGVNQFFRADFSVPEAKLVINVNGLFWHSKQTAIDHDAVIAAYAEMAGYRVITWWDFEIYSDVVKLFDVDPYLSAYRHLAPVPHRSAYHKDSAGIKTLNKRRAGRNRITDKQPIFAAVAKRRRKTRLPTYRVGR